MIDLINYILDMLIKFTILDMLIKFTILAGVGFVGFCYFRIKNINKEIEKHHREFESGEKIDARFLRGTDDYERKKQELREEKDLKIGHLQRKRDGILSILPFLK